MLQDQHPSACISGGGDQQGPRAEAGNHRRRKLQSRKQGTGAALPLPAAAGILFLRGIGHDVVNNNENERRVVDTFIFTRMKLHLRIEIPKSKNLSTHFLRPLI